jgi:hypothetical protein
VFVELNTLEVFLVKAMKFELVVYTPFDLMDYMVHSVTQQVPSLVHKTFTDSYQRFLLKAY